MSDSVQPYRRQSTRHPRPWDFPGKSTGVDCHFLLWCTKVKSESEVTQLCTTLSDPTDCSLPGSSLHGIFQARVLEWCAIAFSLGDQDFFLSLQIFMGKIDNTSVQSLSRVQLFVTPRTAAHQASLSITNTQSPPKPMSIESMMPSNHLILYCPLLLLSSNFSSIRVFPMYQLFTLGGQSIGVSASDLPMDIQSWFPLGISGLISLQFKYKIIVNSLKRNNSS